MSDLGVNLLSNKGKIGANVISLFYNLQFFTTSLKNHGEYMKQRFAVKMMLSNKGTEYYKRDNFASVF